MNDFVIKLGQAAAQSYLEKMAMNPKTVARMMVEGGLERQARMAATPELAAIIRGHGKRTVHKAQQALFKNKDVAEAMKNKVNQREMVKSFKYMGEIPSLGDVRRHEARVGRAAAPKAKQAPRAAAAPATAAAPAAATPNTPKPKRTRSNTSSKDNGQLTKRDKNILLGIGGAAAVGGGALAYANRDNK